MKKIRSPDNFNSAVNVNKFDFRTEFGLLHLHLSHANTTNKTHHQHLTFS